MKSDPSIWALPVFFLRGGHRMAWSTFFHIQVGIFYGWGCGGDGDGDSEDGGDDCLS